MSLHNPYQIATCGQNSQNTFTLASNGILIDIFIEDIPIPVLPIGGETSGIIPGQEWPQKDESDKSPCHKKVTVVATVDGKQYSESITVDDCVNLTVKDVEVDVQLVDTKPIITIRIKK